MTDFKGEVFRRGEPGYEAARVTRIFNGFKPARYPALIVFAADAADVVAAVQLAAAQNLTVSIRAGGHSWAAWSLRDESLLLDLVHLNTIAFDETTGLVGVGPATKGGLELNPFLAARGLFFGGGHCPTVGVGGFLLQGGQGWNCRGGYWACERVMAIDVVTAAGELLHATETEHAELLWAARGAGPGFFGIVTCFYLQPEALPKVLNESAYIYPMRLFKEVAHWLTDLHHTVAAPVEIVMVGMCLPDWSEPVLLVHGLAFVDTHEAAAAALAPFETCPVLDQALVRVANQPTTMAEQCEGQLRQNPEDHNYAVSNAWLNGSPEEVVTRMHDAFATLPTPKTFTLWYSMAPLRPLPDMAFSLQTEVYFATYTIWQDPADEARCRAWVKQQMHRLAPVSAGQYLGDSDFTARQAKFVSEENWTRLQALRRQYDPQDRFHAYLTSDATQLNYNEALEADLLTPSVNQSQIL